MRRKRKQYSPEFKAKVARQSSQYHKSWSRKIGHQKDMAKSYFKRDKGIVAASITTKVLTSSSNLIPIPGASETAKVMGKVMRASTEVLSEVGGEALGGYLLNRKLKQLQKTLKTAQQDLEYYEAIDEDARKAVIKMELKREIDEIIRKQAKYKAQLLPEHAKKLQGRLFKLKEATRKAADVFKGTRSISSTDTEMDIMARWTEYFSALHEVEHYQIKCRDSINHINVIAGEAEAYLNISEGATKALRLKYEPALEKSFDKIIAKNKGVTSIDKLQQLIIQRSLEESGLA